MNYVMCGLATARLRHTHLNCFLGHFLTAYKPLSLQQRFNDISRTAVWEEEDEGRTQGQKRFVFVQIKIDKNVSKK